MGLLPEGEELRMHRRQALLPLTVGLVLLAVGIAVTRLMINKGDGSLFLIAWGAIWFLGSGAGIVSGLRGLLRPPVFALLTDEGVTFTAQRIRLIRWRDLAAVRLGLRTVTRGNKTEMSLRTPLILTVRDVSVLKGEWLGGSFTHPGHALGDGTAEILLKTNGCPLTNEALICKLSERAGTTPDLRPADPKTATLGGVKLNQPPVKKGGLYLGACVFLGFGLFFAGLGVKKLLQANASHHWSVTQAEILSAKINTSTSHGGRGSNSTSYTPRITYRYTVADRTYTGDRAAFVYESSANNADAFIKRFPPGSRVVAYYDPQDPAESVLVREGAGLLWIFVAFGTIFAVVGGVFLRQLLVTRKTRD